MTETPSPTTLPTRRKVDPNQRLDEIEAEIARVRTREEKRLIAAAHKAGLFDVRLTNTELRDMMKNTIADLRPGLSTLAKLNNQKGRVAKARRKDDGRRKALLGGFLVAQCRHKPDLHAQLAPDIRAFLEDHSKSNVAEHNLALLAGFLADPFDTSVVAGSKDSRTQRSLTTAEHRVRAHRQILLGTWLLAKADTDPEIAKLVFDELDGFLREDGNIARNRKLLADLLPEQ